ncbi:MAG: patatin-like phospholipase family protein, partial [Candidatus Micrarchaeia archaeon]
MAMPAELKELSRCIDPTARGDKKTLGVIAQRYFENNREKLKEDPTSHGPTGLCFDYNLFVKNGNMSIVFEGGGIKGYAHLGAYLALLEEGMLPKNSHIWFYGTSAGAVAAIACSLITSGKMTVEEAYRKFAFHPV